MITTKTQMHQSIKPEHHGEQDGLESCKHFPKTSWRACIPFLLWAYPLKHRKVTWIIAVCCTLPWKGRKYLKPRSAVKPKANVLEEAILLALSILGYTPTSSTNCKWKVFFKVACVLIMRTLFCHNSLKSAV